MVKKTLVAVLASRDSIVKNNELARVFEKLYELDKKEMGPKLKDFHFLFCGGTFSRLFRGFDQIDNHIISSRDESRISWDKPPAEGSNDPKELAKFTKFIFPINEELRKHLLGVGGGESPNVTVFPNHIKGGVILISNLVVKRLCNIVWPFFSPITEHWTRPENLALLRLCDLWNAKRLMNADSVRSWWINEANKDAKLYQQDIPVRFRFCAESQDNEIMLNAKTPILIDSRENKIGTYYRFPFDDIRNTFLLNRNAKNYYYDLSDKTVAMIAPDSMKSKMVDFVLHYENEFARFKKIIATENTGEIVEHNCRKLKKIEKCLPGPRGGNIEIATEILFNRCNIVIFFVDPLHPHPHIDDIRVVFGSCMAEMKDNDVRILTSEVQAREWIEGVIQHNVQINDGEDKDGGVIINKGDNIGGDKIVVTAPAIVVARNAHAHDMNFIWQQSAKKIDLGRLETELETLRSEMNKESTTIEQDLAVAEVAKAQRALMNKEDGSKVLEHLEAAGKWALSCAEKIGVPVAVDALRAALRL